MKDMFFINKILVLRVLSKSQLSKSQPSSSTDLANSQEFSPIEIGQFVKLMTPVTKTAVLDLPQEK